MIRVARVLLSFYPAAFRTRYGVEVIALLRDQAADVRRRDGWRGAVRMWLFQLMDLLRAGLAERRGDPPGGPPAPQRPGSSRAWEGFGRDVRHTLRLLARTPGFTIIAIGTLALGIGATSAIFTVIDGVLLTPLPYPDSGRLVAVFHSLPTRDFTEVNHTDSTYLTYHDDNRVFEQLGAWIPGQVTVTGLEEPETVEVVVVSEGVFTTLGVRPALGRGFQADDTIPGPPTTVVLSHGYWSRRFGADPSVLGDVMQVDGVTVEVIGVMGPEFRFLDENAALFLPLSFDRSATSTVVSFDYRVLARLHPGMTLEGAEQDLQRLLPVSVERYGWVPAGQLEEWELGINIVRLKDSVIRDVGDVLWILLGTVSLVLLIACVNVANLLMVRAEGRHREIAMRTALGASRGRLLRQFFVESAVLSALGATAGLLLAYAAVPVLLRMAPTVVPRAPEIGVDATVLLFTLVVSTGAAAIFGLLPVFQRGFVDLVPALKEGGHGASGGRSRNRVRNGLAIAEVALALVLLVGAGLMVRSFEALRAVDPGFSDPQQVATFRLSLPRAEAPDDDEAIAVYEQLVDRISGIPGVTEVGLISGMTMEGQSNQNSFLAEGVAVEDTDGVLNGAYKAIAGDYFEAAGIPILAGRSISWRDIRERRLVGVVTETLARELWGDPGAALGKRIRHTNTDPWREIIGIVGDVRDGGLRSSPRPVAFWPVLVEDFLGFESWMRRDVAFVVRTNRADPLELVGQLRQAVWAVRPNLPLVDIGTLDRLVERNMADTTFMLTMLLVAAAVAVVLGTVGIYGVISYTFEQRIREVGIRVALGATRRDVLAMVLRQGGLIAAIGVGIGAAAATGTTRFLASQVFGVSTVDVVTYVSAAALVGVVALLASYVPARRAARADPLESLRR